MLKCHEALCFLILTEAKITEVGINLHAPSRCPGFCRAIRGTVTLPQWLVYARLNHRKTEKNFDEFLFNSFF